MDAKEAITRLKDYLYPTEPKELESYDFVYYMNLFDRKACSDPPGGCTNDGFDNENGEYLWRKGDHISFRFEIKRQLGKGSFGIVFLCHDHKDKIDVALKVVRNKQKLKKQGTVEVGLLKYMKDNDPEDWKNIIRMHEYFDFWNHLCIVFEKLSINLYDFLKENGFCGLSENLIWWFAIQLLVSLLYLEDLGIIHCDLKPENILLWKKNKSGIKIIDFGSSCLESQRVYSYI